MPKITLERGDITLQKVDVIVNAANSTLMGGGGVDGAIHSRGGPQILEECRKIREEQHPEGLPTGSAVATTAGLLEAKWVIHTVGPIYSEEEDRSHLLAACHIESLRIAAELGANTIAFPAISTGAYGYPLSEAATIAIGAVKAAETSLKEVRFVLFDDNAYQAFSRALKES